MKAKKKTVFNILDSTELMYKRLICITLLLAFTLISFGQSKSKLFSLNHGNLEREYFVYAPENIDANKPAPLLLAFHGFGGTAYMFMNNSGFNEIAEKENFIIVYPQGSLLNGKGHWNVGGWTRNSTADDVGFIKLLIEEVKKSYNIDPSKLYAAGMSNGGYMSIQLACEMGDVFAAVASVTGSMTPEMHQKCTTSDQVPILQLHGTSDGVVPYGGGQGWTLAIDDVIAFWVDKNNANSKPKVKKLPDLDTADNSTVERYSYRNDSKNIMVMHYKVINGGHDWFGNRGNKDIRASEVIWDFFSKVKD